MKRLFILALFSLPVFGQTKFSYVSSTGNQSVSAAYAATLQQPATNSLPVSFPIATNGAAPPVGASVFCSAACVASVILNGTAATTTAGTVSGTTNSTPPAVVKFFTASNQSGGTTLVSFNIAAGQTFPIDMSQMSLPGGSNTLSGITISIASVTATVNITFYPLEQH
jgi:hypothetical protein